MESWHRVGQKVVCLDGDWSLTLTPNSPVEGGMYTISKVVSVGSLVALHFVELPNPPSPLNRVDGGPLGFGSEYFRPVRDTSIESLRALLNPTSQAKREYMDELAEHAREDLHAQGFDVWH